MNDLSINIRTYIITEFTDLPTYLNCLMIHKKFIQKSNHLYNRIDCIKYGHIEGLEQWCKINNYRIFGMNKTDKFICRIIDLGLTDIFDSDDLICACQNHRSIQYLKNNTTEHTQDQLIKSILKFSTEPSENINVPMLKKFFYLFQLDPFMSQNQINIFFDKMILNKIPDNVIKFYLDLFYSNGFINEIQIKQYTEHNRRVYWMNYYYQMLPYIICIIINLTLLCL